MNNLAAQTGYYAKYQLVNKVSREKISFLMIISWLVFHTIKNSDLLKGELIFNL